MMLMNCARRQSDSSESERARGQECLSQTVPHIEGHSLCVWDCVRGREVAVSFLTAEAERQPTNSHCALNNLTIDVSLCVCVGPELRLDRRKQD